MTTVEICIDDVGALPVTSARPILDALAALPEGSGPRS